jgi:hypothetical protein
MKILDFISKDSQTWQVKSDFNSFPYLPNSISCLASGFQKYTCKCLPLLPFISFHYCSNCLCPFPVNAIFLNWSCNHWSDNFKLTYSLVDCKGFIKQHLKKGYVWKKKTITVFTHYCILQGLVKERTPLPAYLER